jgi:tetratricopeptide (TPR) repeat protein
VPFLDFVLLEDNTFLDTNPYFASDSNKDVLKLWKKPYLIYMPLTYSVWGTARHIGGPKSLTQIPHSRTGILKEFRFNAKVFHLLNLSFHLLTVFLIFWLFCFLTHHPIGSFFGALLFAIHPVQVESVAWVSGFKETLAGFFGVLSIFLFLLGQETPPKSRTFKFFFLASTLSFLSALFSNPTSICVPLIIVVIQYFLYKKERFIVGTKFLSPWFFFGLGFIFTQRSSQSWSNNLHWGITLKEKTLLALDSLSFYFSKILTPLHLGVDYGRTPQWVLSQTSIYTTAQLFFVFLVALTLFFRWNKMKWALASQGVFLAALLPVFAWNRLLFETSSSVADHDLYLPLLGFGLGLAFTIKFSIKKSWVLISAALLLVLFATRSYFQTGYWRDTPHLLSHALELNPESAISHRTLGYYFEKEEDYEKAISHFRAASRLNEQAYDYNRLGNIYLVHGNFGVAKTQFEKALSLTPLSWVDYHGLGLAWRGLGNNLLAQENFAKANALSPKNWATQNALRHVNRELSTSSKRGKNSRYGK